jgi:hypothetical protein
MRRENTRASPNESVRMIVPTPIRPVSERCSGAVTWSAGTVTTASQPESRDRLKAISTG